MDTTSSYKHRLALIFERQWLHVIGLIVLLSGCLWAAWLGTVQTGALWGLSSIAWYWFAIATTIGHQVYVWFCWQMELHAGLLSRVLGNKAFSAFAVGFAISEAVSKGVEWPVSM